MSDRTTRRRRMLAALALAALCARSLHGQSAPVLARTTAPTEARVATQIVTATGSGFPSGAIALDSIVVTLQPAVAGTGATATAPAVSVAPSTGTIRRIAFYIPATIQLTASTTYLMSVAGATAAGAKFTSANKAQLVILPSAVTHHVPVANAGGPYSGNVGQAIAFNASGTTDAGDLNALTYTWAFGDGTVGTGVAPVHAYASAGNYNVSLTVADGNNDTSTAATTAAVIQPNRPPVANAGGPYSGNRGEALTVTGTATDADNDPLSFTWSFGDGTPAATGTTASHTYAADGTYTITLTVNDGRGGADTKTTTATIAHPNGAPTANPGGPYQGTSASAIAFNGSRSSDPDNDALTYEWNFGDAATATGATPSHAYAARGNYTVTLTVRDTAGLTNSATTSVVVNGAPTANAGGPYSANVGTPLTLNGGSSTDPDGDPLIYTWNFGDGTAAGTGVSPAHTYATEGTFTVTLTVNDGKGGTGAATTTATVSAPANRPPVARFTAPAAGDVNHDVAFDAAASSDPDSDAITFSWDFGDGTPAAAGRSVSHRFASLGTFTVTLTVSDGRGASGTAQQVVTIANHPPVARITMPGTGDTGHAVTLDASSSTDPDGDRLTYSWDFGDQSPAGGGVTATHRFASLGTFTVRITVTDAQGATNSAEQSITIANRPPVARFTAPAAGDPGQDLAFDASSSSDADGDPLTFTWDFGDQSAPGSGQATTHRFAARGRYTVRLTVADDKGATSSAEQIVVLANRAPVAQFTAPANGNLAQAVSFDASGSTDSDGDALTYTWDFGDKTPAGSGAAPTHTYAAPGTFTVRVTVTDGFGGSNAAQRQLSIVNRPPTVSAGGPYTGLASRTIALAATASDPDGDTLSYQWDFGDGTKGATASTGHAWGKAGAYQVTVTATDAWGASATSNATVTLSAAPNLAPTAGAGGPYAGEPGVPVHFDGTKSSDPEQEVLTYAWTFGDAATGQGVAPTHAYAAPGSYSATLTVTDPAGATSTATATVTIAAGVDRTPPVVSLAAPVEGLPGSEVKLVVQASDNVGVTSVTITGDGIGATEHTAQPYERTITIPPVATPGSTIRLTAVAHDAAGNEATAQAIVTIAATPDTEKPVVSLRVPAEAVPGATVRLTASATDNRQVTSVAFLLDGAPIGSVGTPPYELAWQVPADSAVGSVLAIVARASDAGGNSADAAASITVTGNRDETPPAVTLSAPAEIAAGTTLVIAATASDQGGVASVSFSVNGAHITTTVAPPYEARYVVPATLPDGAALRLEAQATDFVGLQATASGQTRVTAAAIASGQGVLLGEVYDDATGLPLPDADVTLTVPGAGSGSSTTTRSDARGRYSVAGAEGRALVTITKTGWTVVHRSAAIVAGQAQELFDARLTRLAPAGAPMSSVVGGNTANGETVLTVPPGALRANAALALTVVGQQGVQGAVPPGWSPVAVVDVSPADLPLDVPATLRTPNAAKVAAGTSLVAATWDRGAQAWRVLATAAVVEGGALPDAPLSFTGQVAWLLADTAPVAPPQPAAGELIPGVPLPSIPGDALATVLPQPKVLFYQPGVKSEVSNTIPTASPVSSGVLAAARIDESYRFYSGAEIHPDPFLQDLVFYQVPGQGTLAARHVVSPSETFEALSLERGVIAVQLHAAEGQRLVSLIGPGGATVDAATGERLQVPAGACTQPTAVQLARLSLQESGVALPAGLEFIGGVTASFVGTLVQPATLSVPRPEDLTSAAGILLVRIAEIRGESRLLLVARGRLEADRLVSDVTLPGSEIALDGVRVAGRYLFLRTGSAIGFAAGRVLANSAPAAGALVSNDSLSIVSLSAPSGTYGAAAIAGAAHLSALDLAKNDNAMGSGDIVAGQTLALDLALVPQPPRVLSVTPADGAASVPLSDPIVVTFSEPVTPASVTPQAVLLTDAAAAPVVGTLSLSANNTIVTLRPADPLAVNTAYTLTISPAITDLAGYSLAAPFVSRFTSLDTLPPPPPPAGSVSATIPANDGYTTVKGTQGTAALHDTVVVANVTKKTSTPVLLDSNGGFLVHVAAALGDRLQLVITDQAGNQTVVDLPPFRQVNPDGSVSQAVSAGIGRVEGPGGIVADIAAGTFPDGAVVTIKPVSEAEFPVKMTAEQATVYSYSGGLTIDFGGATPQHYVNVSIPAGAGDKPGDQWMVSQVIEVDGVSTLNVVDTAKLIDGRIRTSSPPCPGVTAAGMYGIHKSAQAMAVIYGTGAMRQTADLYRAIASQSFGPSGTFVQPGGAYFDDVYRFCLPVMSGRISMSLNTVDIGVPFTDIGSLVTRLRVENKTGGREDRWDFSRDELYVVLRVSSLPGDTYAVYAEYADGTRKALPFTEEPDDAAHARFRVHVDAIPASAVQLTVDTRQASGTVASTTLRAGLRVQVRVQGGKSDSYEVSVLNRISNVANIIGAFDVNETAAGPKPIVLRALPGTIDPTEAEVNAWNATHPPAEQLDPHGMFRTKVEVVATGFAEEIPAGKIVGGGFTFAFDGSLTPGYSVVVSYAASWPQARIDIPVFTLKVQTKSDVVKVITLPAPPVDQPLKLPPLTDDHVAPTLATSLYQYMSFDPSEFLSFTFSEALDADSMRNFVLTDAGGAAVAGHVIVTNGNKTLTFLPDAPLRLATSYTAAFHGVKDLGGNDVAGVHSTIHITTLAPRAVGSLPIGNGLVPSSPATLLDLQFMTVADKQYAIGVTNEQDGYKLVTIDVTNPATPIFVSGTVGGYFKNKLVLVPNAKFDLADAANRSDGKPGLNGCAVPASSKFEGTLAVAANANTYSSAVQFFDVTKPDKPCMAGLKMLTANPEELSSYTDQGTEKILGFARSAAVLTMTDGPRAYTAVQGAGLFVTEIKKHIPEVAPQSRKKDPMLGGDYSDVLAVGDRLLTIETESGELQVIDPNLAIVGTLKVGDASDPAHAFTYKRGVPWDANGDGKIASGEFLNLAIVATNQSIKVVDATRWEEMRLVATVPMPAGQRVRSLEFDPATRRVWAVTMDKVHLVDLSGQASIGLVDANGDGTDDRIAWSNTTAASPFGVRLDDRGYVYIATSAGLEVLSLERPGLHGTAKFTFFPVNDVVGIDFDHAEMRPIRHARVTASTVPGVVYATTFTDDYGQFEFTAPRNTDVTIQVDAAAGSTSGIDFEVHKIRFGTDREKGDLYSITKTVHTDATTGEAVADINATTDLQPGTRKYVAGKRIGAAFNLLDMMYGARRKILDIDPNAALQHLDILWEEEKQPGTACSPDTMFVNGVQDEDTDEYDATVLLHEYGHHLMATLSRTDSPAGDHEAGDVLDPRLAFQEGLVTALGNYLAGTPIYVDTRGKNKSANTVTSLENGPCQFDKGGVTVTCAKGFFDEFATMAMFWDLIDGVSSAADPDADPAADRVNLGLQPVWQTLMGPMRSTPAFVTMSSFLYHLSQRLAGFSTTQANLRALAGNWGMEIPADEFGDHLYVDVVAADPPAVLAPPVLVFPFAAPSGIAGHRSGDALGTRNENGDNIVPVDPKKPAGPTKWNNKLYNRIYLKVVIPTAGTYELRVHQVNAPAVTMNLELLKPTSSAHWLQSLAVNQTNAVDGILLKDLEPGTYFYQVMSTKPMVFTAAVTKQ